MIDPVYMSTEDLLAEHRGWVTQDIPLDFVTHVMHERYDAVLDELRGRLDDRKCREEDRKIAAIRSLQRDIPGRWGTPLALTSEAARMPR